MTTLLIKLFIIQDITELLEVEKLYLQSSAYPNNFIVYNQPVSPYNIYTIKRPTTPNC